MLLPCVHIYIKNKVWQEFAILDLKEILNNCFVTRLDHIRRRLDNTVEKEEAAQ